MPPGLPTRASLSPCSMGDMNFASSNIFEMGGILESALKEEMELDSIKATPSPIGRSGSERTSSRVKNSPTKGDQP